MSVCLPVSPCTKYRSFCESNFSFSFAAVLLNISGCIDHAFRLCKTQFLIIYSLYIVQGLCRFPLELQTFCNIACCCQSTMWGINPFPNRPLFLRVCCSNLLKILWEKEKLLVTSNISFSHSVFYPSSVLSAIFITFKIVICKLYQFGSVKLLFGKGLSQILGQILVSIMPILLILC